MRRCYYSRWVLSKQQAEAPRLFIIRSMYSVLIEANTTLEVSKPISALCRRRSSPWTSYVLLQTTHSDTALPPLPSPPQGVLLFNYGCRAEHFTYMDSESQAYSGSLGSAFDHIPHSFPSIRH